MTGPVDDSAPGTYGDDDPGGGPYDPETGIREWYNPKASALFGQWMRLRRQMLGITQAEIADRMTAAGIKIDFSAVARLEKEKRKVSLDEAELIARILGVDLSYMTSPAAPDDLREWVEDQRRKQLGEPAIKVTRHPGSDLPTWRASDREAASERQSNATKA